MNPHSADDLVRDLLTRALAVVGLLGIALIHVLDAIPTFSELPYKGWLYVALIISALAVAAMLVRSGSRRVWALAVGLVAASILAFVFSRTVGLPSAPDDVGNWSEPLGVAALLVEGPVLAVAAHALTVGAPARVAADRGRMLAHPA